MNGTDAIRWGLYYRLLASLSFLLGLGIAVAGVWIGASGFLSELLFGDAGAVLSGDIESPNSPAVAAIGVGLGLIVWQIGKAAALHKTLTEATQTELQSDLDHEAMKSDLLEVLDERLSDMHAEVEQTRRGVNSLQQDKHADAFAMGSEPPSGSSTGPPTGEQPPEQSTETSGGAANSTDQQPSRDRSGQGSDPNAAFDN